MKDFEILFAEGRVVGGECVTAKVWKMDPNKYPQRGYSTQDLKIAAVVGKKVHKTAVRRNRAKRQMREAIRLLIKDGRIAEGYMIAVVAKPIVLEKTYAEIQEDIVRVLRRGGVLKP